MIDGRSAVESIFALLLPRVTEANSAPAELFGAPHRSPAVQAHPFSQPHQRHIHKESDRIVQRTLSGCFGRGDLNHNNRSIITENVNKDRIRDDIIICQRSLTQLYHELFDEALAEYNDKQKRRDRKIANYQEHIRHSRQEKEFHEAIFQVGNRDDTGVDSDMCKEAAAVLEEYARSFEERNPHLKLFNAVIHMDESTPHLHLDFVPVCDEKRKNGMRVRNSLTGALRQQGLEGEGISNTITMAWLLEHGIEWVKLGTHEKHKSVSKFKAEKLREEIEAADKLLDMKKSDLSSVEENVRVAESTLEDKKQELSESEEKLSSVTAETEKADAELSKKLEQINRTLKYLPDLKKHKDAEHEYLVAVSELHDMMKSGMTILRNKDSIISRIDTLKSLTQKAMDKRDKAELTIYDLRQRGEEVTTERDDALEKLNAVRAEKSALYSELKTVKAENMEYSEVLAMLERIAPTILRQAKEMLREQQQRKQAQQLAYQPPKKKKSWDLE